MSVTGSSPAKIVLFGEWAVLEGAPGIAMAVPPRLKALWKASTSPSEESVVLVRGDGEMALWDPRKPIKDQKNHIPDFLEKAVAILSSLMMRSPEARSELLKGGELRLERGWPLEFGLGSSSAIVACLLEIFCKSMERIAKWQMGREILRDVQGGRASALDLAAQLRGSFVAVSDHKPKPLCNIYLPKEICFLHAGSKADTSKLISERPLSMQQIQDLGKSAEAFLSSGDWLKAIHEHAAILNESSLWPAPIREARQQWRQKGWIEDMKSCGAGGGDTWLIWCQESKQDWIRKSCEDKGWAFVKYAVEPRGVSIDEL